MFKRKTLFILGAGSSFEAGFPLGKGMATVIGDKMDIRFGDFGNKPIGSGDFELFSQVMHTRRPEAETYRQAAILIRDGIGFSQSIDDFLDQHRSNPYVNLYGKAAIVKTILEAERASKLYFNPYEGKEIFDVSAIANTWFAKFMYMLGRGVPKENVREILDNVAFIVFNYDRCVELFLVHALKNLYQIHEDEAKGIVADLHIMHPYGAVPVDIAFGNTSANYFKIAESIKTYTEQSGAADVITQIATEIQRAQCVVFLGFAYHSQNMSLLRPAEPINTRRVFGTAFGMSDSDVDIVAHDIAAFFNTNLNSRQRSSIIRLENKMKCADLFDNYARSLTGGD
jgi:hypothetical protein